MEVEGKLGEKENEKAEAGKKAVLSDLAQGGGNWGYSHGMYQRYVKRKIKRE